LHFFPFLLGNKIYRIEGMKLQNKFLLVATFMGLISVANSSLYSQEFSNETGFALGVSSYMGDANKSRFFYNPGLAGGMVFRYNFSFHWALKANLLAGQVYGDTRDSDNAFPTSEQIDFKRSFAEVGTHIEWNFLPYSNKYRYLGTRSYTPYLFVGAGLTYAPKERNFVDLHIPFGIGMKFKLKNRFNIALEYSLRKLFIDDFDVTHATQGWSLNQPYGIGSSLLKNQDWYSITMLCLTWDFGLRDDPCHGN
jgi:hypothetical protein